MAIASARRIFHVGAMLCSCLLSAVPVAARQQDPENEKGIVD
jgi:hypothetical protein